MDQTRIAQLRLRFGWNQEKFAKAVGLSSRMTSSHWETGFRTPSGPVKRFLELLEAMPESDFKKAAKLLGHLADRESQKRP